MALVKINSNQPETFFALLKEMNIPEGAEFEIEKVENGFLLKAVAVKPPGIKSPLASPYITLEEQKRRFEKAAPEMQALGMPEDAESLDSDWWIKILETTPEQQPSDISLDE